MEVLKDMLAKITLQDVVAFLSFVAVVIGGGFALHQWRIGIKQKRAETVEKLIKSVRDDMDIATIMDIVDWDKGFCYNGEFRLKDEGLRKTMGGISNEELFKMIDRTLAHFSYICYLKNLNLIKSKDMRNFEYEIRRLADNGHIANYLHSLHLWSESLGVSMSFSFLLDYCIVKGYFTEDIKDRNSSKYTNWLL